MSGLATVALLLVSLWLGILTVSLILVIRQIGLLTVRLSLAGETLSLDSAGPEVGNRIPDEVVSAVPELDKERTYLLLISAGCTPCRELATELSGHRFEQRIIALVPGREEQANDLIALLPPEIEVVQDPKANEVAEMLHIESAPFVMEVDKGTVIKKAHLYRGALDFVEFLEYDNTPKPDELVQIGKKEAINND